VARELDADWFIHHDADEFRESPWPGVRLADAIARVDALGYNAVDFATLQFWPVHDDFRPGDDVRTAFPFYAEPPSHDRLQIRGWKKTAAVDLVETGGHEARFEGRRVFPLRFIARHYPIRGQAHGQRKVLHERRQRFLERERARGWHVQYDDVSEATSFIRDPASLRRYDAEDVRLHLTLRHRGVEALETSIAAAAADAAALRQRIDGLVADLAARTEELARRTAEGDARTSELEERTRERDAQAQELQARAAELEDRRREIDRRTEELALVRERLDATQAALTGVNADAARLRADLAERAAELSATRGELAAAREEHAATRGELATARADAAALRAQLDASTSEAAEMRAGLDARAKEVAGWRAAVDDLTRRLDAYERSLSWRWTAPARAAYRLVTRRR